VVAGETRSGRAAHFVVCSRGEAGSNGTPSRRTAEARRAATVLGATVEFLRLDGDARLELKAGHAVRLAAIIRRVRPAVILAPTLEENQHPDHWRLGHLVRDAVRLARYGGLAALKGRKPHTAAALFYYAVSPDSEPPGKAFVLVDISGPAVFSAWKGSMEEHASQMRTRNYVDLQVARARVLGLGAGIEYAQALFPNDPIVLDSLSVVGRPAGRR